jgi:UDP-N-acetylenolpyruvoylglucosamine reductase
LYIYDNLKNMIRIQADFPLQAYNTFGIEAITSFYTEVSSIDQIRELMATDVFNNYPHFILGEGAISFQSRFSGPNYSPLINGTEITDEDTSQVVFKSRGGYGMG